MDLKEFVNDYVSSNADLLTGTADKIWDFAEIRFDEHKSADLLAGILEKEGFLLERGVAQMPTAFIATYGTGKPVIGFLGEYDALSGLSQKGGSTEKIDDGKSAGHGCGHHMLGVGAMGSAIAVKRLIEKGKLKGTVKFFGCPAEEGGSGKAFMVRDGIFNGVDACLSWHPCSYNQVVNISSLANFQILYKFKGTAAHAAFSPHLGRSALDAVELMNVGVNFLREHVIQEARIHYAITNSGGMSPNVVQADAEVLYLIRAPKLEQAHEIYERVNKIAQGAATMTETEVEIKFIKACSNILNNSTLEKLMYENAKEIEYEPFTKDEEDFVKKLFNNKLSSEDLTNIANINGRDVAEFIKTMDGDVITYKLIPYKEINHFMSGSTDVGDVTHVVPTAQIFSCAYGRGTALHSWEATSQGITSIAHKGLLYTIKVMANTAIDLYLNDKIIDAAKKELNERGGGASFVSPIPKNVIPNN